MLNMKQIFRGGVVVSGSGTKKADVLTEDEIILAVEEHIQDEDAQIIDVSGKYLFPGFVDAHTHMDLDVSGTVTVDGFDTGTKAELAGGTTCIVDFATQNRGETLAYALEHWHGKADGKASCDYAFHLAISDWNHGVSEELEKVIADGIHSFKLYTTYDAMVLDDQSIYEVFARLKGLGCIVKTGVSLKHAYRCLQKKKAAGSRWKIILLQGRRLQRRKRSAVF